MIDPCSWPRICWCTHSWWKPWTQSFVCDVLPSPFHSSHTCVCIWWLSMSCGSTVERCDWAIHCGLHLMSKDSSWCSDSISMIYVHWIIHYPSLTLPFDRLQVKQRLSLQCSMGWDWLMWSSQMIMTHLYLVLNVCSDQGQDLAIYDSQQSYHGWYTIGGTILSSMIVGDEVAMYWYHWKFGRGLAYYGWPFAYCTPCWWDYHDGVENCGVSIAKELAWCGFRDKLLITSQIFLREQLEWFLHSWQIRIKHELVSNTTHCLSCVHPMLAANIMDDFPDLHILKMYVNPLYNLMVTHSDRETTCWRWLHCGVPGNHQFF